MSDRPKRRAIPVAVKRAILERQGAECICGCGQPVSWQTKSDTHFDHEPALRLRAINADGTDYIPAQHDPRYIDARCPESHHAKTHGTGASTAGSDVGKIKKERKRNRAPKRKRKIPPRANPWAKGRKMQSRGFGR